VADADFPRQKSDEAVLAALSADASQGVAARLRAVVEVVSGRIVFTTSFGIEDQLIAHHIFSERLPIEVATLDTGRLFPSTYKLWQETEERYGIRIKAVYPSSEALSALIADQGINGFYYSKDARLSCCEVRKVEPLRRALTGASAWITGLRADQSQHRSDTPFAAWDAERALVKIAPLFDHSRDEVTAACAEHNVPINELHAKGFASIGCEPCTRALRPGEPERAGRWWWETEDAKECGLHVDASGRLVRSVPA
jgi:phosphoadenosine phosphosulfate reductase